MGKSSTGKDTIFKRLLSDESLELTNLVSYTTRPIRENEVDGVEYHFVDAKRRDELDAKGKIIELRRYDTCYGPWDYFTVDDGEVLIDEKDYLIIGTLESYQKIRNYYGKDKIMPIYIEVEDGVRLQRALNRERKQKNPRYDEMCRRFLTDGEDFSEEKLQAANVDRVFINNNIMHTVAEISKYIKSARSE
ncbi:MAG: guanylate kinase [Lachnospiraceae bacterium]|nr:guanylate kinase [Lachnospiraceae bacterium]